MRTPLLVLSVPTGAQRIWSPCQICTSPVGFYSVCKNTFSCTKVIFVLSWHRPVKFLLKDLNGEVAVRVVVAEWLRRWTRNPLGSPRAGSNPADYDIALYWDIASWGRMLLPWREAGLFSNLALYVAGERLPAAGPLEAHGLYPQYGVWFIINFK